MNPTTERAEALSELQKAIRYRFKNAEWLERALTHSSYANEKMLSVEGAGNERIEFLGDAVLGLCISDLLYRKFPERSEGALSKIRSDLVNRFELLHLATELRLGELLRLGRGEEKTDGRTKPSILADTFEALIGAIYLDGGFRAAYRVVERIYRTFLSDLETRGTRKDYKTELQELMQKYFKRSPRYVLLMQSGPDHRKMFEVGVEFRGRRYGTGSGRSKQEAEQRAAEETLSKFRDELTGLKPGQSKEGE